MVHNLIFSFLIFATSTASWANTLKYYEDEYVSFSYPKDFDVSFDIDDEGYKEIYIEGPKKTSVFITVVPTIIDTTLPNFAELIHDFMLEKYGKNNLLERTTLDTLALIDGKQHPGILNMYKIDGLFKDRELHYTIFLLNGPHNTILVNEERSNKGITAHRKVVLEILSSVSIKRQGKI